MLQIGGLPDLVVHFSKPDELAGEHSREIDIPFSSAELTAARDANGTVVERILCVADLYADQNVAAFFDGCSLNLG